MVIEAEKKQKKYKVIGTRPIRPDGLDKVTGRALFGADIDLPGMLYGAILRSPHAHARIVRIDTAKAAALPGVKAVITNADFPDVPTEELSLGEGAVNLVHLRQNVLAEDKVLYHGHALAAVAATSAHIATEALRLIDVTYELLEPVLDVRDAMKQGSPILHADMRTRDMGKDGDTPSNIASHIHFELGDADRAFSEADLVIEREFTTRMVHQGYIEPHNATVSWDENDHLTIWMSTQGAFNVRDQMARLLRLPTHNVRVVPMEIGGGFGGKISVYLPPVGAILSHMTGHPVKLVMNRTEVLEATGPTSGSYVKLKMGATKDGRLIAAKAELAYEAGAFPGSPVGAGCMTMLGPYDITNATVDGYDVVVNKPRVSAYRAPGAPIAAFACESVVDELAEQLGLDPLQFRLNNASREGTRQLRGNAFPPIGNIAMIKAALASDHYNAPLEGPNRGRGVANGFWFNAGMQSSLNASINGDGTVSLIEGNTDIGGTRASIAMQLAETLGLPMEAIKPTVADTDSVGYNAVTGGSRITFASGWAAYECGMDIRRQMCARAAIIWGLGEDDVEYVDGVICAKKDAAKKFTFAELASRINSTGAPIIGTASVSPQTVGGTFALHIADVEVDPETGKVDVLRYTAFQDPGTAIHPSYVEGQMQGGASQGIGWALNEEYYHNADGTLANASFLDYRMPTTLDLPMIDAIMVETPNPGHPYGVRGVGEVPIVPPLATLANAVYRATGVRFHDLPISPRRVLKEAQGLE